VKRATVGAIFTKNEPQGVYNKDQVYLCAGSAAVTTGGARKLPRLGQVLANAPPDKVAIHAFKLACPSNNMGGRTADFSKCVKVSPHRTTRHAKPTRPVRVEMFHGEFSAWNSKIWDAP
jgi:hypothetical protein